MQRHASRFLLALAIVFCGVSVFAQAPAETPRERREKALTKLLEGQRYYREMLRLRGQTGWSASAKPARAALLEAVQLDPSLAEAYTTLAEIALTVPPNDIEEALTYATLAIAADKNNFGGARIQARLFTIKSGLNNGEPDRDFEQKAIESWKTVVRLDPRNAEAWAFLSEFYRSQGKTSERIDALKKWQSSSAPVETRFFQSVMGSDGDLSPEAAGLKLGEALFDAGRIAEAVEVLNNTVADDPENTAAVDLLRQALDLADARTATVAIQTLQQAVFANQGNAALTGLLARVLARSGRVDDAVKLLTEKPSSSSGPASEAVTDMRIVLGDILVEAGRVDEAVKSYQSASEARGLVKNAPVPEDDRDFYVEVTEKIVRAFKFANRFADAKIVLENSRKYLSPTDSFIDREMIEFARQTGKTSEALQLVRTARIKFPDDPSFIRTEAKILCEAQKCDDGVALIRGLMGKSKKPSASGYDDFANLIFISTLYSGSSAGGRALEAAKEALKIAVGDERRRLAELAVASALQRGGELEEAETLLRRILNDLPGNPLAQNNLGYLLAEKGVKLEEALSLVQQALKTDPNNSSYLDSLGWVYARRGEWELARDCLARALILEPASATTLEHLGDVAKGLGDEIGARDYWKRGLQLAREARQVARLNAKLGRRPSK